MGDAERSEHRSGSKQRGIKKDPAEKLGLLKDIY
jgi:hypothetical protein